MMKLLKIIETIAVIPVGLIGGLVLAVLSLVILPIYIVSILIEDIWEIEK